VQFIAAEAVHRLLPYPGLVQALREAHRGPRVTADALRIDEPGGNNVFLSLGAWAASDVIAFKLVGVFPDNFKLDPPQPSVQGIVALFSAKTGAPLLAADGAAMTERKTVADSALGADLLARRDVETLLVVGAGALAPHAVAAHIAVRPSLRRVLIWNRTPARAQAVAAGLFHPGVSIAWTSDLDEAVAQSDVISCVTMSEQPLVKGVLLKPGAHLDLIGGYTPEMRECDDDAVRRGRIFMDTISGMERCGDLSSPLRDGIIKREDVLGDLWQLCSGELVGRQSEQEITVYKNIGGAHLDLFTARWLRAQAQAEAPSLAVP
jgi:ornithine cyclodeaminase